MHRLNKRRSHVSARLSDEQRDVLPNSRRYFLQPYLSLSPGFTPCAPGEQEAGSVAADSYDVRVLVALVAPVAGEVGSTPLMRLARETWEAGPNTWLRGSLLGALTRWLSDGL